MDDVHFGVRLTVIPDEGEAQIICGLLRAHGIECSHRDASGVPTLGGPGWWYEILVPEEQLPDARAVLAAGAAS